MSGLTAFARSCQPRLLSVLRIVAGFMFMLHGMQKLLHFPAPFPRPVELFSLLGLAGTLELFGGARVLIGLFTRPVAFILSGEMAFAYFMGHFPKSFWPVVNGGDAAALYCFVFLYLAAAGPGPWSVDRWRNAA
jgi:putative oxidoreductase